MPKFKAYFRGDDWDEMEIEAEDVDDAERQADSIINRGLVKGYHVSWQLDRVEEIDEPETPA